MLASGSAEALRCIYSPSLTQGPFKQTLWREAGFEWNDNSLLEHSEESKQERLTHIGSRLDALRRIVFD